MKNYTEARVLSSNAAVAASVAYRHASDYAAKHAAVVAADAAYAALNAAYAAEAAAMGVRVPPERVFLG
tara:strand:+ start:847 stop:1053 length:207 start_codon:yes stop_codon:yes gene_type:complete